MGPSLHLPEGTFAWRALPERGIAVCVTRGGLVVLDAESGAVRREAPTPGGFPSWSERLSEWGNAQRVVIADDGSVAWWVEEGEGASLWAWSWASGAARRVAEVPGHPEAIAVSPGGTRLAALVAGTCPGGGYGYMARAFSVADGRLLAGPLAWESVYSGTLDGFWFTPDGARLGVSIEVTAQAGDSFSDSGGWDLGCGPEAAGEG